MGAPSLIPKVQKGDWVNLNRVLRKLAFASLGPGSCPTFGCLDLMGPLNMHDNEITNVDYIDFDLDNGIPQAEGRLKWNGEDGVPEIGLPGGKVNMQIGNEMPFRVKNVEEAVIPNGRAVIVNGASGNKLTVRLPDLSSQTDTFAVVALATEDLSDPGDGFVNTIGYVRGDEDQPIDTSGFAEGGQIFLGDQGTYLPAPPAKPNRTVFMGIVKKVSAVQGEIWVNIIHLPMLHELSDVLISSIEDGQILKWDSAASVHKNTTPTVKIPLSFEDYDAQPARTSESNIHGALLPLATGQPLDSVPTDIIVEKGTGKIMISVIAGSDFAGTVTITGETIDRDTGASTPADTDTITIDALTTDTSTTDTNGNSVHSFTGAYLSSKWFTGTVTLSTTDLTLTDVDVYHVSFEQFNDQPLVTLDTFDANILTTSVNAEFDAYLFSLVTTTGDKCDIANEADLHVGADGKTAIADKYWRLRRGALAKTIDGTTDGVWVDIHYANSPAFVEDVTIKVWATQEQSLTLS